MKTLSIHPKLFYSTILGNIVEHYDKVLFGLVAPFLTPLFFPKSDPLVALILIYFPFGLIAKPLGALFWGKMGDRLGRKKVLYFSLMGMSLTLLMTSILPTYEQIGFISAFLLHFKRALTAFFAAGEGPGASLILIENTPQKNRDLISSYYEMSSILGTFIASLLVTLLAFRGEVLNYWRVLFFLSGLVGCLGFWFRRKTFLKASLDFKPVSKEQTSWKHLLKTFLFPILAIIFLTGFLCSNYLIAMKMMNAYLPLLSSIKPHELMAMHTLLLLFDFTLLPVFGWVSQKIGKERLIIFTLTLFIFLLAPLFKSIENPSLGNILVLRMTLVLLGIAIAAPFNAWAIGLLPKIYRFRALALSRAIGSQFIGGSAISISLWSVKQTGWIGAPCYYLYFSAFFALLFISLTTAFKKNKKKGF